MKRVEFEYTGKFIVILPEEVDEDKPNEMLNFITGKIMEVEMCINTHSNVRMHCEKKLDEKTIKVH